MNQKYFMKMACEAAKMSTCLKRKVGAVIVRADSVIAQGANGGEREYLNCLTMELGGICYWKKMAYVLARREQTDFEEERFQTIKKEARTLCLSTCAERRAIYQVLNREKLQNASIYCTTYPCPTCAKMIRLAGIKQVCYMYDYDEERAICQESSRIFEEAGIVTEMVVLDDEMGAVGKRTEYEYRETNNK
ncbi:MAG: hypothetical protein HDR02_14845 [Lachnospiraceae bacterium]|nr:hypothetical protein [Lachnospiraceae bacterium]